MASTGKRLTCTRRILFSPFNSQRSPNASPGVRFSAFVSLKRCVSIPVSALSAFQSLWVLWLLWGIAAKVLKSKDTCRVSAAKVLKSKDTCRGCCSRTEIKTENQTQSQTTESTWQDRNLKQVEAMRFAIFFGAGAQAGQSPIAGVGDFAAVPQFWVYFAASQADQNTKHKLNRKLFLSLLLCQCDPPSDPSFINVFFAGISVAPFQWSTLTDGNRKSTVFAATRQGFKTRLERLQSQSSHQWMSKTRFFTDF